MGGLLEGGGGAKCMLAPLKNWDLPTGPPLPTPMYNLYIALNNIGHFCGREKWMRIAYTCHSYTGFSLRFHLEVTGTAKVVDKSSKTGLMLKSSLIYCQIIAFLVLI